MALVVNDRVKETTAVVGTGAATLLGAALGFQSFAVIGNGNTTYYCISDQGGANWEVGIGTYTSAGTTLARTTVLASSNAGALVVFTAGVKDIFCTYPAEKSVHLDASGNVLFTGTTTAANLAYTGTFTGSTGVLNIGSGQVYKDASGNVGIGTSSPSAKLELAGTTAGSTQKITATTGAVYTTYGNTGGNFFIGKENSVSTAFGASAYATVLYEQQANPIIFYTTSVERMRIDSSGNVGIGNIPSGTYKLEVTGAIRASTTVTAPELLASNGFILNKNVVSASYTFPAGYNAVSVGAVTINSGVVVTVPSTQRWVVL